MTVDYRTGDLFAQDLPAYGHGVNCRGLMGAGIAREIRRRWPGAYNAYHRECSRYRLHPGMVHTWRGSTGIVIYNLATQDRPGPHATLDAIRESVTGMLADAEWRRLPAVGLPRIGAGIGGLAWDDVRATIEDVAADSPVRIVVATLPAQVRA